MNHPALALAATVACLAATATTTTTAQPLVVDMDTVSGLPPLELGGLRRQADLGFRYSEGEGALVVDSIAEGGAAAAAGLAEGDVIIAIDGTPFAPPVVGLDRLAQWKAGRPLTLAIERDGEATTVSFDPPPLAWERLDGLEAEYGVLETPDGARLRTIITRPKGTDGPLPAVFMVQWVGCSTLEFQHEGPFLMVYRAVAEDSGMAMIRVERSANGDSEGPPCHLLDLETEVAHYRHALAELADHPWVDGERIVLMGNSLGTKVLPLVADGFDVAGAIASSGGGLSHFERMVNFDRHALSHEDQDPRAAQEILMAQMPFQVMYLLEGKTPDEIVAERPDLEGVWETIAHTGDGHHYGRPYAYHHQLAQRDILEAWLDIEAPILVHFNAYDQFEELRGAELIVDTVNRFRPGSATLVVHEGLGHSFRRYPSQLDAYEWRDGEPGQQPAIDATLAWLAENGLDR